MIARARLLAFALVCLTAFVFVPRSALAQSGVPADIDAYVAKAMKTFDVPGIAVAVVKDGRVVFARGYGVRRAGDPAPVDTKTVFGIGSNTKAFTTAAISILAEEGKLSWDDPVTKHLPGFQMYDPYVTREMRIRDLATHRSGMGLGAGDLLYFPESNYTRDEVVQRVRFLKPVTSFRSEFAYDNILYCVAGQIIPAVSGKSWDDFIRDRILRPIGMDGTTTSIAGLKGSGNVASPHSSINGKATPIAPGGLDNIAAAGAINSSVDDMARWMIVQLDNGSLASLKPGSTERLFSAASSKQMWSAQTILAVNDPPPGFEALRSNFSAYGLGWGLSEMRGHKLVSHTGGVAGFVTQVRLIPDMKLGVVVLTNAEEGVAFASVSTHILDGFLADNANTDWVALYDGLRAKQRTAAEVAEKGALTARAADSHPSLPLEKYAGLYRDAWRDDVTIAMESGKLVMRFSRTDGLVGDLEHWQYDTFIARWRDRSLHADAYAAFSLKPDGSIDTVKMTPVSPLTDFSFDFQDLLLERVTPPTTEAK